MFVTADFPAWSRHDCMYFCILRVRSLLELAAYICWRLDRYGSRVSSTFIRTIALHIHSVPWRSESSAPELVARFFRQLIKPTPLNRHTIFCFQHFSTWCFTFDERPVIGATINHLRDSWTCSSSGATNCRYLHSFTRLCFHSDRHLSRQETALSLSYLVVETHFVQTFPLQIILWLLWAPRPPFFRFSFLLFVCSCVSPTLTHGLPIP